MGKLVVENLGGSSFSVSSAASGTWQGASVYYATANNNGDVVLLPRPDFGQLERYTAHWTDIEIYDEEGAKVTCNSVGDVVAVLNAFVGNFRRSGAANDLSSHAETITIDDNSTAGTIRVLEQGDYDAIVTKEPNRIYYILEPIV